MTTGIDFLIPAGNLRNGDGDVAKKKSPHEDEDGDDAPHPNPGPVTARELPWRSPIENAYMPH